MENTNNEDTIHLLSECDAGSKMAVSAIDDMIDKVQHDEMRQLLSESRKHHEKLGNDLHSLLLKEHSDEKDPSAMAKGMSWLKTNMKITMDKCDATIADLMTDGCNMGIKSLYRYLNQYPAASHAAKDICHRLISIEETLRKDLRAYL